MCGTKKPGETVVARIVPLRSSLSRWYPTETPRCISRLRCCRYFQDCAHRVAPLIRESPRDCVSPRTVIRGRRAPFLLRGCGNSRCRSRASLASREFFVARTYLSQTGGYFMIMARTARPRANRGENKAQQGPSYTCALLEVRKTWFTVRRGSDCTRILASRIPRDVLIWIRSRGEMRCVNIFLRRGENVDVIVHRRSW